MRLVYLQANQAWVFMFGDQITPMGDYGRFFASRDMAVAAALDQGLRVDAHNNVVSIEGESGVRPWEQPPDTAWTMPPEKATAMLPPGDTPDRKKQGSILDPIHATLDPAVFDHPAAPEPALKLELINWLSTHIFEILDRHGYTDPQTWLTLVLTGSLTTYQYSDESDADVSLFIDSERLPDWSRAEMIGFMVSDLDGVNLPGTPHPMQAYVVASGIKPQDLYKPGLRSGYMLWANGSGQAEWLVPPERDRAHDVEQEMNDAYTVGLLAADKLDLLLHYEPQHAIEYWHQLHKQRMNDQTSGRGDYSTSNIVFKMLVNRGLAAQAAQLAGDRFIPA